MDRIGDFIDKILQEKDLSTVPDDVRVELKRDLEQRLLDQIDRAVLVALPEDKAAELSAKLDDENFTNDDAAEFIKNSGVDMQSIALETMMRFRELYLGNKA